MSSGEDDTPLSDDSLPSYDGYKDDTPLSDDSLPSYDGYKRSSSEEGDALIYPVDDITFHEDVIGDLSNPSSFETDKFPIELTMPPMIRLLDGVLGDLNRSVFTVFEDARRLVNQIYRTDDVLRKEIYLDSVWTFKYECYTNLQNQYHGNSGLKALVRKICQLDGLYYKPPDNLWNYLHFFWYDSDTCTTVGSSITPEPYHLAPDFHTTIIDALKVEKAKSHSVGVIGVTDHGHDFATKSQNALQQQLPGLIGVTDHGHDFATKSQNALQQQEQAIYHERPDKLECPHYMKHGYCKFQMNCKFHHPGDRLPKK